MKRLFDVKYLHDTFGGLIDSKREGRPIVFLADSMDELAKYIDKQLEASADDGEQEKPFGVVETSVAEVEKSRDMYNQFLFIDLKYRYAYYDPNFAVKIDHYKNGIDVEARLCGTDDEWRNLAVPEWKDEWEYRSKTVDKSQTHVCNQTLAGWLAEGKGQLLRDGNVLTFFVYPLDADLQDVTADVKVRKWSDTDWHEPTIGYMFEIED